MINQEQFQQQKEYYIYFLTLEYATARYLFEENENNPIWLHIEAETSDTTQKCDEIKPIIDHVSVTETDQTDKVFPHSFLFPSNYSCACAVFLFHRFSDVSLFLSDVSFF